MELEKRDAFLLALMAEPTIRKAISRAGISPSTAYKWLNDPEFKMEWNRLKTEALQNVTAYLQQNLGECAEELMKVIKSDNTAPQVKINGIQVLFNACRTYMEAADVLVRLDELEASQQEARKDESRHYPAIA